MELFTGGFIDSRVGLVIAERRGARWRVLLANSAARSLLVDEIDVVDEWIDGPLRGRVESGLRRARLESFETGDGRVLNIDASTVSGNPTRVAVQLLDISESVLATQARLDAERERATALAARLELQRRQTDFVATASHELRTPITSIAGYLDLLKDEPDLPDTAREWISVIDRNTARLRELVEDLLALSRASEATEVRQRTDTVAAASIVREAVDAFTPAASARGVRLEVDEVSGDVLGDPHERARALGNLVSNAVKFSPTGGIVRLSADTVGPDADDPASSDRVRVIVSDSGPGIDPDALPLVFERFYRAPAAQEASTPGTGLGLAIARDIARANQGTVDLSSPPGEGVTATLTLRRAPTHPA